MSDLFEMSFSAPDLKAMNAKLLESAVAIQKAMAPAVETVGRAIEERSKQIAADAGSTSIPPTIKGAPQGDNEYRIQAGGASSPIASLWEMGNHNSRAADPTFRHPRFGDREHWYDQARHPFLRPANRQLSGWTRKTMDEAAVRELTSRGITVETGL